MASEPKKPIEEMLEAAAKARRDAFGPDPGMPNPMRARLHDELARLKSEEEKLGKSWLEMFLLRLAVAAATATVLVMGSVIWFRSSHPSASGTMQVAKLEENAERRIQNEPASSDETFSKSLAAGNAATPNVALTDTSPAKIEPPLAPGSVPGVLDESKKIAGTQTAEAAPAEVSKGYISEEKDRVAGRRESFSGGVAAPAAAAPLPTRDAVAALGERSDATGAAKTTSQFLQRGLAQSFRNNVAVSPSANILNNFQVEQEGTVIRVVDSDGSTYTGKIEPVEQAAIRAMAKQKQTYDSRVESKAASTPAQSRFRTSGYNLSLKKSLVFEGDYLPPGGSAQQQQFKAGVDKQTDTIEQQQDVARIIGTARAHGEKPVQVDALAVISTPAPAEASPGATLGSKRP
jgi:hypothetical protein